MMLVIKRHHTKGTCYDSIHNDALLRAVNEQLPGITIKTVFSDFFIDKEGVQYTFDTTDLTGYSRRSFKALQDGLINNITLTINVDHTKKSLFQKVL